MAIAYTKYAKYHGKSKHIETKYHFVRGIVAEKNVAIRYMSTYDMIVDPFTKAVTREVFVKHTR